MKKLADYFCPLCSRQEKNFSSFLIHEETRRRKETCVVQANAVHLVYCQKIFPPFVNLRVALWKNIFLDFIVEVSRVLISEIHG